MASRPDSNLESHLATIERIRRNAREREAQQAAGEWLSDDLSGSEWPRLERRP
jgi:hypothetical protein